MPANAESVDNLSECIGPYGSHCATHVGEANPSPVSHVEELYLGHLGKKHVSPDIERI